MAALDGTLREHAGALREHAGALKEHVGALSGSAETQQVEV